MIVANLLYTKKFRKPNLIRIRIRKYQKEKSSLVGIIRVEAILVGSEIRRGLGKGETSIGLGETLNGRNSLWAKPAASVSNRCIDRTIQAYRLTSWAFVRRPLAGSSWHLSQKRKTFLRFKPLQKPCTIKTCSTLDQNRS